MTGSVAMPHEGAARGAVVRPPFAAVIFDMDGVVTDSAAMHAEAWKLLFDEVLTDPRLPEHSRGTPPFDIVRDYRNLVDGRSREDGVRAFLRSREIDLPTGTEDEGADAWSVSGLAAKKNEIFLGILAQRGVRVFPGTEALLQRLRDGGVPSGLVTASRNARALLAPTGIMDLFDVVVDGTTAQQQHLVGKPDAAMFTAAAALLGVPPSQAVIVEDAVAGVQAGRRGGFGLVVGIARHHDRAALEAAGADLVVEDVSQLDLGVLRADPWMLTFEGFDPAHEGHREALTTLANGYLGTRGAAPESRADDIHYPGTYLSGVSNRLITVVEGVALDEEQLVNVPNWLPIDLRIGNGDWWSAGGLKVDRERTDLELRRGLLVRNLRLTDSSGRSLRVTQRRLVSLARAHVAALETTIVPEGWAGTVTVRSGIDASVTNANVTDLRDLAGRHLTGVVSRWAPGSPLLVEAETTASRIRIATAVRTEVGGVAGSQTRLVQPTVDHWCVEMQFQVTDGRPVVLEKTAAIVTSKDAAIASPAEGAVAELAGAPAFGELLSEHQAAWETLWARFDVGVRGLDRQGELALHLHQFHLMQTLTRHSAQLDAGVPARGLHGEGYRGHVFWDELFVLPSLIIQVPEVARAALDYRWRRLPAARRAASALGLNGALFPWQSGTDGREETPLRLFNARSGRWIADNSRRQRHVGLAVAYNAWQYYVGTGDIVWLAERGGELIIDVARLFASMATHDPLEDRFHIEGVMGPDEYHDGYPDSPGRGIRDNAYTNVMTAWVCGRALDVLELLSGQACDELVSALQVSSDEPTKWEHLRRTLAVPLHDGIISQFDGYEALEELDWDRYRSTYGNIGRLDLILEAERDTTNRYKLAKQADVLMLVYLLGPDELLAVLGQMGYQINYPDLVRTIEFYLARTAHGSTLSRVVHAAVLAPIDIERAWVLFRDALVADLDDTQGGTTHEGVHLGAMAGTVDIVRRTFVGLRLTDSELVVNPSLPTEITAVSFKVHYQGHHVEIDVDRNGVRLNAHRRSAPRPLHVCVGSTSAVLEPGVPRYFAARSLAEPVEYSAAPPNDIEP